MSTSADGSPYTGTNAPVSRRNSVAAGPSPGRPNGRRVPSAAGSQSANPHAPSRLYSLRAAALWDFIKRQPKSFLFVCFYLFMEYVRPQQIWTSIAGPPYSKFIIGFAVLAFVLE